MSLHASGHLQYEGRVRCLTFETVAEDVLQDGDKVEELWRRVVQRFRVGAVQQSLDGEPAHAVAPSEGSSNNNKKRSPVLHFNEKMGIVFFSEFPNSVRITTVGGFFEATNDSPQRFASHLLLVGPQADG